MNYINLFSENIILSGLRRGFLLSEIYINNIVKNTGVDMVVAIDPIKVIERKINLKIYFLLCRLSII